MGAWKISTISIPADAIARWEQEIASLPARKRKNWKDCASDRMGAKCLVVYDMEGVEVPGYGRVHFLQRMSQQKKKRCSTRTKRSAPCCRSAGSITCRTQ